MNSSTVIQLYGSVSVGDRIRAARKQRGWTLADLSAATEVPHSTLSKFETNSLSLPLDRIFRIADALELTVTDLFAGQGEGEAPAGRRSIHRAGRGKLAKSTAYRREWLFTDLLSKRMYPVMQTVLARSLEEFGPLLRHEGEEFVLVLRGKVLVVTDTYEPVLLDEMDGIYLDSRMGHAFLNGGKGDAVVLNVPTAAHRPNERAGGVS